MLGDVLENVGESTWWWIGSIEKAIRVRDDVAPNRTLRCVWLMAARGRGFVINSRAPWAVGGLARLV